MPARRNGVEVGLSKHGGRGIGWSLGHRAKSVGQEFSVLESRVPGQSPGCMMQIICLGMRDDAFNAYSVFIYILFYIKGYPSIFKGSGVLSRGSSLIYQGIGLSI
jgi:hypothetical protein